MAPKKRSLFVKIIALTRNFLHFIDNEYTFKTDIKKRMDKHRKILHELHREVKDRDINVVTQEEIHTLKEALKSIMRTLNY